MKIIVLHSGIPFPNGADYMAESCARAFRLLGHEIYELGGYHKGRVREIYKVLDLAEEIKPDKKSLTTKLICGYEVALLHWLDFILKRG